MITARFFYGRKVALEKPIMRWWANCPEMKDDLRRMLFVIVHPFQDIGTRRRTCVNTMLLQSPWRR
jgi:hypothetical protein